MSFVAEKYGEIGSPVLSRKRSAPPLALSSLIAGRGEWGRRGGLNTR